MEREKWVGCGMVAALVAVGLTSCGGGTPSAGQAGAFVRQHTECPVGWTGHPEWSPDGASIYYEFSLGGVNYIRVINSAGGNARLLVSGGTYPMPSPDGKMLMFQRENLTMVNTADLFILDLDTLKTRRIVTAAKNGTWSPDSQWIAYVAVGSLQHLQKVNVRTGEIVPLASEPDGVYQDDLPVWSPDGQIIAFGSDRDDPAGVYLVDSDGGGVTRLVVTPPLACDVPNTDQVETPAAWSPDGTLLAITRWCAAEPTLRFVGRDGKEVANWSRISMDDRVDAGYFHDHYNDRIRSSSPVWSPDGGRILANMGEVSLPVSGVANLDGSHAMILGGFRDGRWSPDGKAIVYSAYATSRGMLITDLRLITPDGTKITPLTQNSGAGRICLH